METGKLCRSKQLIPAYKRNRMVFQNDTENPCGSSFFVCIFYCKYFRKDGKTNET